MMLFQRHKNLRRAKRRHSGVRVALHMHAAICTIQTRRWAAVPNRGTLDIEVELICNGSGHLPTPNLGGYKRKTIIAREDSTRRQHTGKPLTPTHMVKRRKGPMVSPEEMDAVTLSASFHSPTTNLAHARPESASRYHAKWRVGWVPKSRVDGGLGRRGGGSCLSVGNPPCRFGSALVSSLRKSR
jgi:hypothetical protein